MIRYSFLQVLSLFFLLTTSVLSQVSLPNVWRDSMILQRDLSQKIWGSASKNEKIKLTFNKITYKIKTDTSGSWQFNLPVMPAGGPYDITIEGKNKIVLSQILFGDVYLCIGQSNMVHQMDLHNITYAKDIENANEPEIRHLFVPTMTELKGKRNDLPQPAIWKSANPKDVGRFSAVAYFFAKSIYAKYKVPIGLINASVGGTPIEAWTSENGLKPFIDIANTIIKNKDTAYIHSITRPINNSNSGLTSGDMGLKEKWYSKESTSTHWRSINIPGYWEDQGLRDLNGVVWYRKKIVISESAINKPIKIHLGRIVDADELYINGLRVANTTYQYPQRRYALQKGILHEGENLFVIRISNTNGKGGFVPDKPYFIEAGDEIIDLKGTWEYKVGEVYRPNRNAGPGFSAQNQPASLYNAMIAPFENFNIKGVLWYQGESNTARPEEYESLQIAQINDLRSNFKNNELPFLFVQLPGFMDYSYLPAESNWARMRESQLNASKTSNSAMAVAIDLGEWNDIHPDNKKDVGERLALAAKNLIYNEKTEYSGPIFTKQKIDGNKIILEFDHIGTGLTTKDGESLSDFAIAGEDKKFVWASASIEDDHIVVSSTEIIHPKYVRYAWADNPINPNLCNKEGLLASPFRTDK